jgi:hypothetical protein
LLSHKEIIFFCFDSRRETTENKVRKFVST